MSNNEVNFYLPENNWGFLTEERINKLREIYNQVGDNTCPRRGKVLKFLETNFNNLKCIVVGMDPYPSMYEASGAEQTVATGRSFEVGNMSSWLQKVPQASVRNILCAVYYAVTGIKKPLADIRKEIECGEFLIPSPSCWFDNLEKQGVLWLNAALTVEPGKPGSHQKYWDDFMTDLAKYIVENSDAVWMLWGNNAQERFGDIVPLEKQIRCQHPRMQGFIDENPFKQVDSINWRGEF
jgi:uracil-DNA glycosylase